MKPKQEMTFVKNVKKNSLKELKSVAPWDESMNESERKNFVKKIDELNREVNLLTGHLENIMAGAKATGEMLKEFMDIAESQAIEIKALKEGKKIISLS
jgi:uncharacterized protein (UPF0335 family)